jgi:hypothetical protein
MLQGAFNIAIVTRLSSKSFNITGLQTLGIVPVTDKESPYYDRIPIPPLLDAQVDEMWMHKMKRIRKTVIGELRNTILSTDKRQNWFKVFLTIFVLLSNLEFLYQKQTEQKKRYSSAVSIS